MCVCVYIYIYIYIYICIYIDTHTHYRLVRRIPEVPVANVRSKHAINVAHTVLLNTPFDTSSVPSTLSSATVPSPQPSTVPSISGNGDGTGSQEYLRVCKELGHKPVPICLLQLCQEHLSLQHRMMIAHDGLALGAALCLNRHTKTVDVSGNSIGDVGMCGKKHPPGKSGVHMKGLLDGVQASGQIFALKMARIGATRATGEKLGSVLMACPSLKIVDVSNNMLEDKGAVILAKSMAGAEGLTLARLNLSNNRYVLFSIVCVCVCLCVFVLISIMCIKH
jgi:hypothetical protein